MKRYTDWNWTPLAWHSFVKYVSLPLDFVINLVGISALGFGLGEVQLYTLVSMGITVAAEIGLIRRRWWGPCCLLAGYGIAVVFGFYLVFIGAAVENPSLVSQAIGLIISGALMVGINWVYYQKRRALFSPEPVWLEAERAAEAPVKTEYAGVASAPGAAQVPKSAGGYSTIYREGEPENAAPENARVKAPVEARKEPEDGVALLLQLQAEEEAKRAAETLPVTPHEAPKKKSAPLWSVVALGGAVRGTGHHRRGHGVAVAEVQYAAAGDGGGAERKG
jgi:signal transduction histidine kinase